MVKLRRISLVILTLYMLTAILGGQLYWRVIYQDQKETNLSRLNRFTSQLNSQLEQYVYIPRLLSKDSELIDALKNPANSAQTEITNRYLENVNRITEASDTYLINPKGTTIAASNWQKKDTFIGRNFAFRPYFQQAIKGNPGQYFALGSTSGKRGFYYAYPVIHAAEILGIVVVKTNLSDIEKNWSDTSSYFVVTDSDGVIFMSSKPEWLYKSFTSLTEQQTEKIKQSQRYLDKEIISLNYIPVESEDDSNELSRENPILFNGTFLCSKKNVRAQELTVRVLSPKVDIFWSTFGFLIIVTLSYGLLLACWLLIRSRQVKQRQIAQIEAEARQRLEFLVMERTAELQVEIGEREKTELMLRQTQNELIQAAKFALLGEMSASISHELNNPLAAIRSFAENGKKFLDKGKPERTVENLTRISALTDRIAKISQQLKSFARKSSAEDLVITQVQPVVISALELMKTRLRSAQVKVETDFTEPDIKAKLNPVLLEQVLINLISNAIEAMDSVEDRKLYISVTRQDDFVSLTIKDSGTGILTDNASQLFEPFYTTKQNGLGLGLSISLQIMQSMQGDLKISASETGGACFNIFLLGHPILKQT